MTWQQAVIGSFMLLKLAVTVVLLAVRDRHAPLIAFATALEAAALVSSGFFGGIQ